MTSLKKFLISTAMTAAMAMATMPAISAEDGNAKVREAAETTLAKVQEALGLAEQGGNKDDILNALSVARQSQKEFRYEQTERLRQKANDNMKKGRDAVEAGDLKAAAESLKKSQEIFTEMKAIYDAAH